MMEQVPALTSTAVPPRMVQTPGVVEVYETRRPLEAEASSTTLTSAIVWSAGALKSIVCSNLMLNDFVVDDDAAYRVSPPCEATTLQRPTPTSVTDDPLTVQTPTGLVVEYAIPSVLLLVAERLIEPDPSVTSSNT